MLFSWVMKSWYEDILVQGKMTYKQCEKQSHCGM